MSELNSLFLKVKIKKNKLDEFLDSKPEQSIIDNNWTEWWNSKEMCEKTTLTQHDMYNYEFSNNRSIVESWKEENESIAFSNYDGENEIWNFGIVFFGENYIEMIAGLTFVKSIAKYIEYSKENFAIVFDFFWGGNCVDVYIDFKENKGYFDTKIEIKSDINSENLKYAETYLDKKNEEFLEAYDD